MDGWNHKWMRRTKAAVTREANGRLRGREEEREDDGEQDTKTAAKRKRKITMNRKYRSMTAKRPRRVGE